MYEHLKQGHVLTNYKEEENGDKWTVHKEWIE